MSRDPKLSVPEFPTDPTAAYLAKWLTEHAPGTAHDRRIIEDAPHEADNADPYGHEANAASAQLWWDMTEPDKGRWAC